MSPPAKPEGKYIVDPRKTEFIRLCRAVLDNPQGKALIAGMRRIRNKVQIDLQNPNPLAALYWKAQNDLIQSLVNALDDKELQE